MNKTSIHEKKELIIKMRRRGDIAVVCKQVGFSVQIFWTAMKRNDNDYTDAESAYPVYIRVAVYHPSEQRK